MSFDDKVDAAVDTVKETLGLDSDDDREKREFYENGQAASENLGRSTGEFKREFTNAIEQNLDERIENRNARPEMEVWPQEDEFGQWVASHENRTRSVICNSPEFRDTPHCGTGEH